MNGDIKRVFALIAAVQAVRRCV